MNIHTALFPGSFDPITLAHVDIIRRAVPLFNKIVVGIGVNDSKPGLLPPERRLEFARAALKTQYSVAVDTYQGLTVDYCRRVNARYIIRGIRSVADYEYERTIAQVNKTMMPELETIFFFSNPELASVSSSIVREILRHQGDVSPFVPSEVLELLAK